VILIEFLRKISGEESRDDRWSQYRCAAVVAGSVIHVAGWDHLSLEERPETARPAVTFAVGALRELQAHGADVGA
jgi:hypothetical protein